MLLSHELLGQQLRQLYVREWEPYALRQLSSHNSAYTILQSHRHCWQRVRQREVRYSGGEEQDKLDSQGSNCTVVVPLFNMWMRLHSIKPSSTIINPLNGVCRLQLERQPLQQNLCWVISILWNKFYQRVFSTAQFVDAATQTLNRKQAKANRKQNWWQNLALRFQGVGIEN